MASVMNNQRIIQEWWFNSNKICRSRYVSDNVFLLTGLREYNTVVVGNTEYTTSDFVRDFVKEDGTDFIEK